MALEQTRSNPFFQPRMKRITAAREGIFVRFLLERFLPAFFLEARLLERFLPAFFLEAFFLEAFFFEAFLRERFLPVFFFERIAFGFFFGGT